MSETAVVTLTDFLLARIAEDEAVARQVAGQMSEVVFAGRYKRLPATEPTANLGPRPEDAYDGFPLLATSPARVLAECEAKRRAIEAAWADHVRIEGEWGSCQSQEQMDAKDDVPDVVAVLALPYADHPDYREEWRR